MYQNKFYLIVLLALLALAACTLPATPATVPASETAAVSVVATTNTGRTIRHHLGETTIPLAPQRIVALDVADNLLALGITPLAVGDWEQTYLSDALVDVPTVGSALEPNLEVISSLEPDLILLHTEGDFALEQYDLLNQIAPAVVITDPEEDFRLSEREVGLVLGQSEAVEARLAEYEAHIANARMQVADRMSDGTVALVNVRQDHYRLYGIQVGYTGPFLYGELGMTPAALVQDLVPEDANINISLETLPRLDADHMFVLYQTTLEQQWQDLQAQPLWQALPAVQAGHVYTLTGNYWYASGLLAHEAKIADVLAALGGDTTGTPAATTSPLFPLTITDAVGQEFTFDAPPKIGCMFYGCYETLADLGVAPQASLAGNPADRGANFYTPGPVPVHLIEDFQNPELWAAAEVDLIVVSAPADPANDALAQAAPLFHLYYLAGGADVPVGLDAFLKNLELLGQVTGTSDAAAAAIARYERALAKLRTLATPETAALKVALLRSREGYQIYGDQNAFCTVIADVGLGQCLSEGDFVNEISPEELLALDPDWIIYFPRGDSSKDRTDPVWLELSAVKEGRVYDAVSNRYGCCSVRGLYQPLIEYVHHILPAAGAPELLSTADFDPENNWLVQPE